MKKRINTIVSLLLAMILITMSLPAFAENDTEKKEADFQLMSLLPLETVDATLDLSDMLPVELANIKVYDILSRMKDEDTGEAISIDSSAVTAVWSSFMGEDGDFDYDTWKKTGVDEFIDLMPRYYGSNQSLDIIVGSGNQLDPNNIKYHVAINWPDPEETYKFDLYEQVETTDNAKKETTVKRNPIETIKDRWHYDGWDDEEALDYPMVDLEISSAYDPKNDYYINLGLDTELYGGYSISVYKGFYDTPTAAVEAAATDGSIDITSSITGQNMTEKDAGYKSKWAQWDGRQKLTVVYKKNGEYVGVDKFELRVYVRNNRVSSNALYISDGENSFRNLTYGHTTYNDDNNYDRTVTYTLGKDYPANVEYYTYMSFYDGETGKYDNSKVTKAVIGHFDSLESAANEPDIKEMLFPAMNDGYIDRKNITYKANFSGAGVKFTVFANDQIWKYTLVAVNAEKEDEDEDERSDYSDLSIYGAYNASGENSYDTYDVDSGNDTYYNSGYQTILINDTEADMTAIRPYGWASDEANVYCGGVLEDKAENGYSQKFSVQDFTKEPADTKINPRNSVQYTVTAENQKDQTNYNITMVKKVAGSKLFVNGPDEREVFLDNYYDNRHDIFIANIGTEPLTGIKATLNATNAKLDDYWTVGGSGNDTLAPFTTTYISGHSGKLPNIGKIRIIPDGEGDIDGTLTISAEGQENRVIKITGHAGNPKITTTELRDAVKYVPYSTIVTTNNIHKWNKVTFSLYSGKLPKGMQLYESGEIYGVPQETGTFKIKVRAKFSASDFDDSVTTLTLNVLENTDENVDAQTDEGYEITQRVPANVTTNEDQIFEFEYDYAEHQEEFQGFWLDGEKLQENVDYTVEPGSTKITIKSQTFSSQSNGTKHTIAAEYRNSKNEVKKAAQNYTKGTSTTRRTSSGGGGTSSYKVWFEVNGGAWLDAVTVKSGSVLENVPTPERAGYHFGGWYTDKNLTKAFDPTAKITKTTTLYAKWEMIYKVWFEVNGGAWLEAIEVIEGNTVSSLPKAERAGYVFDGWYTDEALTQKYDETAPVKDTVVLYAKWLEDVLPDTILGFRDVNKNDWFYDDISWAYDEGYMVGVGELLFAPNEPVTGGMVVSVLARMAGLDVEEYAEASFEDIFENEWYTDSAKWAKAEGLVDTIPFNPPAELTREQMGVIIDKYLDYVEADIDYTDKDVTFADEKEITPSAKASLQRLFNIGIYYGRGDNIIDPQSNTTRAEFAALMHRLNKIINR